jgi:hypothetical protein
MCIRSFEVRRKEVVYLVGQGPTELALELARVDLFVQLALELVAKEIELLDG